MRHSNDDLFRIALLLIVVLQVSSIYSSFYPDVRWSCSPTEASIFVRTQLPFEGLITPAGINNPECQTKGIGTNVAVLKLPLEKNNSKCGLKFDEDLGIFTASIDVRQHSILILEDDKSINISCRAVVSDNETVKVQDERQFDLRILSHGSSTRNVRYSLPYTLQVRPAKRFIERPFNHYQVGVCTAKSLKSNITVQLTDIHGCALYESIMGDFENKGNYSEATIPTMFRFPDADQIAFSCAISDCEGICEQRTCRAPRESAEELLERTTSSFDIEQHPFAIATLVVTNDNQSGKRENIPKKVTSVRSTVSPLQADAKYPQYSTPQCVKQEDMDLLYGVCIFLSLCSTIGFCMNILLCCLLRRRRQNTQKQSLSKYSTPNHRNNNNNKLATQAMGSACPQDFWIIEPKVDQNNYFERRTSNGHSGAAYASVKKPHIRPQITTTIDFGQPHMQAAYRNSVVSSEGNSDIYSRGDINAVRNQGEMRHSSSTFLTSVETDSNVSSSASNHIHLNPPMVSSVTSSNVPSTNHNPIYHHTTHTTQIPQTSSYL